MGSWSERIEEKFNVVLPQDVRRWFDEKVSQGAAGTSFGLPVEPARLLESDYAVAGGQMLPDSLPLLEDGCGNVISVRFDSDGTVKEVVEWSHEGCNWHPLGESLSEALLYDAARTVMQGSLVVEDGEEDVFAFSEWAFPLAGVDSVATSFREYVEVHTNRSDLLNALLRDEICKTAAIRDIAKNHAESGLAKALPEVGAQMLGDALGVQWHTVIEWASDPSRIPSRAFAKLTEITGMAKEDLLAQDLESASKAALAVADQRTDLAWPFALTGWAAEKRGDIATAIGFYSKGLMALQTTADFTDLWRKNPHKGNIRFCASRLDDMRDDLPREVKDSPFLAAALMKPETPTVREVWLQRAEEKEKAGNYGNAYRCYYNAGWDEAIFDDMPMILTKLEKMAEKCGSKALATLARIHRECCVDLGTPVAMPQRKKPWWKFW